MIVFSVLLGDSVSHAFITHLACGGFKAVRFKSTEQLAQHFSVFELLRNFICLPVITFITSYIVQSMTNRENYYFFIFNPRKCPEPRKMLGHSSPERDAAFCLCPIKRTPGLNSKYNSYEDPFNKQQISNITFFLYFLTDS